MTTDLVAPSPTRFLSVHAPELGVLRLLSEDGSNGDVWPCEVCEGHGVVEVSYGEYGETGERDCRASEGGCDGYGWVHGYSSRGEGRPARPL